MFNVNDRVANLFYPSKGLAQGHSSGVGVRREEGLCVGLESGGGAG